VTLPAFATERRAAELLLSIEISCSHGAQQQTGRTPLMLSIDETKTKYSITYNTF